MLSLLCLLLQPASLLPAPRPALSHALSHAPRPALAVMERSKRDPRTVACSQYKQIIAPVVAQNTKGELRFILQSNSTHSRQEVAVVQCVEPGSSCSACPAPQPRQGLHQHLHQDQTQGQGELR